MDAARYTGLPEVCMSKTTSAQDVYNYVRDKIIARELFPGNRIVEEELADALHTSRTTVRAGLTRLHYDGFIEVRRNRGAFVARPTLADMNRIYEMRMVLETAAGRMALDHITEAALQRMEKHLQDMIELEKDYSMAEYVRLNQLFHWEIVRAAGNEYLEKYLQELFNKSAISLMFYDASKSGRLSIVTHRALLEALKARDAEALEKAIIEDIDCAANCISIG